jgi:site-specific DNA-methyltransferase (adenine-specific)
MTSQDYILGDCVEILKRFPDNHFDSCVTDPPYGLGFMGKEWDKKADYDFHYLWAIEVFRVLKPGAFLLAFGGTRTYHRLVCAVEDAGFEIRDMIFWAYGQGFPKSMDISKAIDKKFGAEREAVCPHPNARKTLGSIQICKKDGDGMLRPNAVTTEAKQWSGWGTALKPACEPICVARKPLSERTVADNVLKYGTGGINIGGCRIPTNPEVDDMLRTVDRVARASQTWEEGSGFKNENNTVTGVRSDGRFPANLILECTCEKTEIGKASGSQGHWSKSKVTGFGEFGGGKTEYQGVGEKDDMKCIVHTDPNCPCRILDEQSGVMNSKRSKRGIGFSNSHIYGTGDQDFDTERGFNDSGGASRFFYIAKSSRGERERGLIGNVPCATCGGLDSTEHQNKSGVMVSCVRNSHPTLKPIKLMAYLVRLVTPPNGLVLDPFLGSGTTLLACKCEGMNGVGIEKESEYEPIIKGRLFMQKEQGYTGSIRGRLRKQIPTRTQEVAAK